MSKKAKGESHDTDSAVSLVAAAKAVFRVKFFATHVRLMFGQQRFVSDALQHNFKHIQRPTEFLVTNLLAATSINWLISLYGNEAPVSLSIASPLIQAVTSLFLVIYTILFAEIAHPIINNLSRSRRDTRMFLYYVCGLGNGLGALLFGTAMLLVPDALVFVYYPYALYMIWMCYRILRESHGTSMKELVIANLVYSGMLLTVVVLILGVGKAISFFVSYFS